MGKFMAHHVDSRCEVVKDLSITVAVDHLRTVPESIVILLAIVDGGDDSQTVVVDTIATENLLIKLPRPTRSIVGTVGRLVRNLRSAFLDFQLTGKIFTPACCEYGSTFNGWTYAICLPRGHRGQHRGNYVTMSANVSAHADRVHRCLANVFLRVIESNSLKNVRRYHEAFAHNQSFLKVRQCSLR